MRKTICRMSGVLWLALALGCLLLAAKLVFHDAPLCAQVPAEAVAPEDPQGKPRKISGCRLVELIKAGRLSSREASYWIAAEDR